MDYHAITAQGVAHVCSVERGSGDLSPLQFISRDELARLQRAEAELEALRTAMVRALLCAPSA
jgi:hypothetical protein